MIFLIARQVHIEKIQNQLRTLKKEKEEADDEESDIPTLFPPAPAEQIRNESYWIHLIMADQELKFGELDFLDAGESEDLFANESRETLEAELETIASIEHIVVNGRPRMKTAVNDIGMVENVPYREFEDDFVAELIRLARWRGDIKRALEEKLKRHESGITVKGAYEADEEDTLEFIVEAEK